MEDCISIKDMRSLDTILSGLMIFANNGYIINRFSSKKKGLLKRYLVISSVFLLPIYFFYSSDVTFSPLWKITMMIRSIIKEIKYCLQLSIPNSLMQIMEIKGLRTVSNYPITCLNLSCVFFNWCGSLAAVTSCIFFPLAICSNIFGQ